MSRTWIFAYGIFAYVVGLGGLFCFMLFLGSWNVVPLQIHSRPTESPMLALWTNVGLMALFGVQHSVMARQGFKDAWTKIVPPAAERSTYVLCSGVVLGIISFGWQPISGTLWDLDNQFAQGALISIQMFGWILVAVSSFLINHFELFGLQQVYLHWMGKPEPMPVFTERMLYKNVRHPLQLGVLIGIWSTPTMTMSHLALSVMMTAYIFIGLHFEEKDLVANLGREYEEYRKRVRMILPFPKRGSS